MLRLTIRALAALLGAATLSAQTLPSNDPVLKRMACDVLVGNLTDRRKIEHDRL